MIEGTVYRILALAASAARTRIATTSASAAAATARAAAAESSGPTVDARIEVPVHRDQAVPFVLGTALAEDAADRVARAAQLVRFLVALVREIHQAALGRVPVRVANRREINPGRSFAELALQRIAYAFAHRIVANSRAAADRLLVERVPASRIAVVPNGLDTALFEARPAPTTLRRIVVVANLIGIIPYTFTVSSQIIVTAALALLVFFTVLIYGLYKNGLKFFKIFVPSGVPVYVLPLVVFIEVLSFLLKPVSHSVRLFANMLAGHIALKVFAGFVAMLGFSLGAIGWIGGIAPLALTIALTALELLVAFLQAYVFAILTCIYLNDAIHPGH